LPHEAHPIAEGRDECGEFRARRFIGEHAPLVELAAGSPIIISGIPST